jgi:hypothetical protein
MSETMEAEIVTERELAVQPKEGVDLLANLLQLEKQMQAYKKLIGIAIQFTESGDWTDQQGTPYMLVSGASKVAAPFGISISIPAFTREVRHDAKGEWYLYTCQLVAKCAVLGIERGFIGTCSSRDKFFATSTEWKQVNGEKQKITTLKPIEDVDEGNVKKKAYTNAFNNAVQNLLGLKKLSWEYLDKQGIKKDQTAKVEYGGKGATDTITEGQSKMLFAKAKAKEQQGASFDIIKEDFNKEFNVKEFKELPKNRMNDALAWIESIKV